MGSSMHIATGTECLRRWYDLKPERILEWIFWEVWRIPWYTVGKRLDGVKAVDGKVYEYESLIYEAGETGGAYVLFPYDIRKEFGRGRVKVHATFDGEPYDGSIVNMGVRNADGSVCYIIGVRKDIRSRIGKQPGDSVWVKVRVRE